jgi:Flp pilus assembly protein TadD
MTVKTMPVKTFIRLLFICAVSVQTAHAMDMVSSTGTLDLTSARSKIKAKDWPSAITELQGLSDKHSNADVYNLLAFSLRNWGDYEKARSYYGKALDLDPNHRGALEYSGELYLKTGEGDKARSNLQRLEALCPNGCEELEDLREAFEQAKP